MTGVGPGRRQAAGDVAPPRRNHHHPLACSPTGRPAAGSSITSPTSHPTRASRSSRHRVVRRAWWSASTTPRDPGTVSDSGSGRGGPTSPVATRRATSGWQRWRAVSDRTYPPQEPAAQAASARTRGTRRRRTPSFGPVGRCRTGAADGIPDSGAHRRPSPCRRVPVSTATGSLVPEGDAPAREVIGGQGERDAVAGEHADSEATHLPRNGGEDVVPVRQVNAKGGIGQHVLDDAVDLDRFFLGHRCLVCKGLRNNEGGTRALAKSRLDVLLVPARRGRVERWWKGSRMRR